MELASAQQEMRAGYSGGSTGVFVSGLVWLAAGLTLRQIGVGTAFALLFLGGIGIFPLSMLLSRLLFKASAVAADNPLNRLAIEGTVMLFVGLFVGWAMLKVEPAMVFPVIALAIGARYATFRTLYGEWLYWVLAAAIIIVGALGLLGLGGMAQQVALLVGLIELGFAVMIYLRWRRAS